MRQRDAYDDQGTGHVAKSQMRVDALGLLFDFDTRRRTFDFCQIA